MPWARPSARHTTVFENFAACLAQRMDKASIARLLRCSWEAVDAIVTPVVVDHIDEKEQLRDLYRTTDPADARAYLKRWCTAAKRSRIPAFANLVRRMEKHADAIVAAVELACPTPASKASTPRSG